jgi:hypothetical protein
MIALRIISRLAFHESRKNHLGNPLSQFIFGSVLGIGERTVKHIVALFKKGHLAPDVAVS